MKDRDPFGLYELLRAKIAYSENIAMIEGRGFSILGPSWREMFNEKSHQTLFSLGPGKDVRTLLLETEKAIIEGIIRLQHGIEQEESNIAILISGIGHNRAITQQKSAAITQAQNTISNAQSHKRELQTKIDETIKHQQLKQKEYAVTCQTKNDLINNMNPKQVSFVLQKSIEQNNKESIELFINKNFDVNFQNSNQDTLLHTVIKYNHKALLQKLVDRHPNVNLKDKDGNTALLLSVKKQDYDLTSKLMKEKGDLRIANKDNVDAYTILQSQLFNAIETSDLNIIQQLSTITPDFPTFNKEGSKVLHIAASKGKKAVVELLLTISPETINALDSSGKTALHRSIENGHKEVVELLLHIYPVKIDTMLLWFAIENGHKEVVELLLKIDPQALNIPDSFERTLLHFAAAGGKKEICELLLKDDPEMLYSVNKALQTPLHLAAANGHEGIVELFLKVIADNVAEVDKDSCGILLKELKQTLGVERSIIDKEDREGRIALDLATEIGHTGIVHLLLDKTSYQSLFKILYTSITHGRKEVFELLIHAKPELINFLEIKGYNALHAAAANGHKELCELLLKIKPELINMIASDGSTALHKAVSANHKALCELLLSKMTSEEMNITDTQGNTALGLAIKHSNNLLAKTLCSKMSLESVQSIWYQEIEKQNERAIVKLLELSPDLIGRINNDGKTALHIASNTGNQRIIEFFLNEMTPEAINKVDNKGYTVLHFAPSNDTLNLLLTKVDKALLNTHNYFGQTLLHLAVQKNLTLAKTVINIMNQEAIDAADADGKTALYFASIHGIHRMLINKMGSEALSRIDKNGKTALHLLIEQGKEKTAEVELLISKMTPSSISQALHQKENFNNHYKIEELINRVISSTDKKINLNPNTSRNTEEYLKKGNLLLAIGKKVEALNSYEKASQIDVNNPEAQLKLKQWYEDNPNYKKTTHEKIVLQGKKVLRDKPIQQEGLSELQLKFAKRQAANTEIIKEKQVVKDKPVQEEGLSELQLKFAKRQEQSNVNRKEDIVKSGFKKSDEDILIKLLSNGDINKIEHLLTPNQVEPMTELNLSCKAIGLLPKRIEAITQMLAINNTLTKLYLTSNNIDYNGVEILAKALKTNTTLKYLDLTDNKIGLKGAKVLLESLSKNSTLLFLDLGLNGIGPQGYETFDNINKCLEKNQIQSIDDMCLSGEQNEIYHAGEAFF